MTAQTAPVEQLHNSLVALGIAYKPESEQSLRNKKTVLEAVQKLYPDWVSQAIPYVNILTFNQWKARGYTVKKGEHSIRITIMKEIKEQNVKKLVRRTACLFAFPQVEKTA